MNDKKFKQKERKKEWKKSKNSAERRIKKLRRKEERRRLRAALSMRAMEELDAVNSISLVEDECTKLETPQVTRIVPSDIHP